MIKIILTIMIGLGGGLAVGAAVTAFFTILGITVRIIHLSRKKEYIVLYQISLVLGALLSCLIYFFGFTLKYLQLFTIPLGFLSGIYIGMVAAALTETLDIISVAVNKLKIAKWLYVIVMAIILGKVAGSLLFFLVPGFF